MYYYSAKNNAFYADEMQELYEAAGSWPNDLKEVGDDEYKRIFEGLNNGKVVSPDKKGNPVLSDPPPPTAEQITAQSQSMKKRLMAQATEAISPLQYAVEMAVATDEEMTKLNEWKMYSIMLNRVDVTDPVWPEVPSDVA